MNNPLKLNPLARLIHRREARFWEQGSPDEMWQQVLSGEAPELRRGRWILRHVPADPRCKLCNAPFRGIGAPLMQLLGKGPSQLNPSLCKTCLDISPSGGAELELTRLFADVRGSTTLAEKMSPMEFSRLIDRYYSAATRLIIQDNGFVSRLIGDQMIALYLPAFSGSDHAGIAIKTASELLRTTGHEQTGGPWIPVGVGIHTGQAFVGKVGHEGVTDFTVLGDAANVTARLTSQARAGEILISEDAAAAANLPPGEFEIRNLELKGRSSALQVWVLRITAS